MACPRCDKVFEPTRRKERERAAAGESAARICNGCLRAIPDYPGMYGAGFESRTPDHEHVEDCLGKNLHVPVMLELCLACYRAEQERIGEPPIYEPPFHDLELPPGGNPLLRQRAAVTSEAEVAPRVDPSPVATALAQEEPGPVKQLLLQLLSALEAQGVK